MPLSRRRLALERRRAHPGLGDKPGPRTQDDAETALAALTPPRGRGKRQSTAEATLVEAIHLVLNAHRVEGLLSVAWEKQVERQTR